jgi:tetratricopeptide (TPR) repeat protein
MPRFHLILLVFLFLNGLSFGQGSLKQFVSFADEQHKKGDYYYAATYYQKALELDSNSVELMWKMAETQRAYKDYVQAERYYSKVYARDTENKYPLSLLQLALMQKQNGEYAKAFETMKLAKKRYSEDKGEYPYKKANQEVEAIAWAIKNYSDTAEPLKRLPLTVNSYDAEFGHTIRDGKLIFSSLRADSVKEPSQEVYGKNYKTHIYSSKIEADEFSKNEVVRDLMNRQLSSGNGTFSLDGKRFYFSNCEDEGFNYRCKIMVANYEDGRWSRIDSLRGIVNAPGRNTTMPHVSKLNGQEVLFFASDRESAKGGLDIYYVALKDGRFEKINNVGAINSVENEISPWFDTIQNRLYFSSSWHYGFGGQDVFYSTFQDGKFNAPVNAGLPINSPANDNYFFKHNDSIFVSSNRIGSYYAKNPTCCSDIFAYLPPRKPVEIAKTEEKVEEKIEVKKKVETEHQKEIKRRLPVNLYFRNDEPDASSYAVTTKQNYMSTYDLYCQRYDYYKNEVVKGLNPALGEKKKNDLEDFFLNVVDKGAKDLLMLTDMIKKELDSGATVTLRVKGFASPVAKTDYNVNLTRRRISSLINFYNEYNNGELKKYISGTASNGGKLNFTFIPFGEYAANKISDDVKDQSNSVFSREAGEERKIQIENISFDKDEKIFPIMSSNPVFIAGTVKAGSTINGKLTINNITTEKVKMNITTNSSNVKFINVKKELEGFGKTDINFSLNTNGLEGMNKIIVQLEVEGFELPLELFITLEVK